MRFSHFIASIRLPQDVDVKFGGEGTRGTQLAPPGATSLMLVPVSAGRPARVRVGFIFAIAFGMSLRRRYASAAKRSTSAFRNSGYGPTFDELRMYFRR